MVAVEVRSWIKRETDAPISTMELLTATSLVGLAEMLVGRSGVCGRFREGQVWCCISQHYFDQTRVKAAHIVPRARTD